MATNRLYPKFPAVSTTNNYTMYWQDVLVFPTGGVPGAYYDLAYYINPNINFLALPHNNPIPVLAAKWQDPNTPPTIPLNLTGQMWDTGTNSPDGQIPPNIAVSNVRVTIFFWPAENGFGGAGGWTPITGQGIVRTGGTNFIQGPSVSLIGTDFNQGNWDYPINPATGVTWSRSDLFDVEFGYQLDSVNFVGHAIPNTNTSAWRTGETSPSTHDTTGPLAGSFFVTVTYTTVTNPVIVGSGGVAVGGSGVNRTFGYYEFGVMRAT